ncbi:MAG: hypothetical protein IVW56_07185 [Candidatus Binataceae bacterium]|nr:hypothetical protein [Candidatus Binataceae bacterium]
MKPRNREVSIFNMSVLDLLTGALGAFCFLTLALFPSYYKTHQTSPAAGSETAHPHPANSATESRRLAGPVPPFGFLDISAYTTDSPEYCASLTVAGAASELGGDLSSFPGDAVAPGSYARFFLFAFRPGGYHLTVRATPLRMPCNVVLTLENPNNQWTQTAAIKDARQPIEFDFNVLSTDLNSNLWNNG